MKAEQIIKRFEKGFSITVLAELLQELTEGKELKDNGKEEELYNELMEMWNVATSAAVVGITRPRNTNSVKLLPSCRKFTPQIKKALTKLLKEKYTKEDFEIAIKNYIREIINRDPTNDYSKHRFSFYEFIKQENGFTKFLNK